MIGARSSPRLKFSATLLNLQVGFVDLEVSHRAISTLRFIWTLRLARRDFCVGWMDACLTVAEHRGVDDRVFPVGSRLVEDRLVEDVVVAEVRI